MEPDTGLRIRELEALVARQRRRIEDLEGLLTQEWSPPVEWQLPRREAQIFSLLVTRERVTKDMLMTAFGEDLERADTLVEVWESHVSKLRKRLKPFGVEIECKRYLGYRLINRETYAAPSIDAARGRLRSHALKRGIAEQNLVQLIVDAAIAGDLVDAILDDADEVVA